MPIPRENLIEAQRPLADRIREFLERSPRNAYTDVEICAEVEHYGMMELEVALAFGNKLPVMVKVREALRELVASKLVDVQAVHGEKYYACHEPND